MRVRLSSLKQKYYSTRSQELRGSKGIMAIRKMNEGNLEQVNEILNWHLANGTATFLETTSINERREWFKKFTLNGKEIALVSSLAAISMLDCLDEYENCRLIKLLCTLFACLFLLIGCFDKRQCIFY